MIQKSPAFLVFIAAIIIAFLLTITLICFKFFIPIPFIYILLFFIIVFSTSYGVFYYLLKKFIHSRLSLIYKTLRKGKFNTKEKIPFDMRSNVLQEAELESQEISNEQQLEIENLRKIENYRREFLGNLAHELKTPTFSIQGYLDSVIDSDNEMDVNDKLFIQRAANSTERLSVLLNDLDQMIKMEDDQLKLDFRPFDIVELANESIESMELEAKKKNIQLKLIKNSNEKMVLADRKRIAQVFTNLLANSIFYGKENGTTEIRLFKIDELITIEIADNGIGIEPQNQSRLFERFYRVEKSRNRNQGGSGLGLAIVKFILDAHKQTITVRSTINIGSTFTFSLDRFKGNSNPVVTSRGVIVR